MKAEDSKLLLRIHDSVPYRRQGRTQCSIMLFEERGFSWPGKTPLPLGKKALLAFSMLLYIHFSQERLGDHHAPGHLAELVSGICICPASMYVMLAGVEGKIIALHLSMFSMRPCEVANLITKLIWSWQLEIFVKSVQMSSPCAKAPRWRPQNTKAAQIAFKLHE